MESTLNTEKDVKYKTHSTDIRMRIKGKKEGGTILNTENDTKHKTHSTDIRTDLPSCYILSGC